ncbi:MAG: [Fe-Fe] hydrogenase large subunit C-terminal domain-containing protein [Anaerovoracaceae bacterium]
MRLKKANCRNCYKCVRACPVKAIAIIGEQAEINEDRCIYCGKCYMVCPQDARDLIGDLDRVKEMIASGEKVYASVSSAMSVFFPDSNLRNLAVVLKKLGFTGVEEMSEGTGRVIQEYTELLYEHNMENAISTICPSTNFLIQKYYPDLVRWMVPVATPLEAHAKMMRAAYGDDIRVVGIGQCIAYHKLSNISEDGKLIDAYLTFEELENWMAEEGLKMTDEEDPDTYFCSNYRWKYPDEPGGMVRALPGQLKYNYNMWDINGESRVYNMLGQMESDISSFFITVMACNTACLGGPIFRLQNKNTFGSMARWLISVRDDVSKDHHNPSEEAKVNIRKVFKPMPIEEREPSAEELKDLLALIGRRSKKDMLDCGGCGYGTCVEKAKAVYQGMADPFMCIPNARDKAEAQSNLLFDNAPNGVLIMDDKLRILEANQVACDLLGKPEAELKGQPIGDYLDQDFFDHAMLKETKYVRDTIECPKINRIIAVTFFKVERHDIEMAVIYDRTAHADRIKRAAELRNETIEVTQEVVEKQMTIAQEIASLLGETTAESKLAFNRLKNLLMISSESDE